MSYHDYLFEQEALLVASWAPNTGLVVTSSALPSTWNQALERICRDVSTRTFNGTVAAVEFEAVHQTHPDPYEPDVPDYIWLSSSITPGGDVSHGLGHSGEGVVADAGEERITETCAEQLQDQIARTGIQWPRGRNGGFMSAALIDGIATWCGNDGERVPIGALAAATPHGDV